MRGKQMGAALPPPRMVEGGRPERRFARTGTRFLTACCLAVLASASAAKAQSGAQLGDNTDTPLWRATHGVLLSVAKAGNRLVAVGDRGIAVLSDDGGLHWREGKPATDELLTSVMFVSAQEGYAAGQDGLVLHTHDGGESWVQEHFAANSDQALFSIISVAPNHVFASGAYNSVVETTDGTTWKDDKLPNLDDDYHLNCAAARGNDVLVTGESGHAFIRFAGAWTAMKLPYDGSQFACLVGSDGSFYSFGLRGTAFRALPGATTWTKIDLGTPNSIFGATLMADGRFALVGLNGVILLLNPVTGAVVSIPPQSPETLSGVVEYAPGKLVAVGDDGIHMIDTAGAAATSGAVQ